MNINIKATNIELTGAIRDYIQKKLEGIEKIVGDKNDSLLIQVDVAKTTNHHRSGDIFRAEANITFDGNQFFVASDQEDLYASIDTIKDETIREIKKIKDRKRSLVKRGDQTIKSILKGTFNKK